MPNTRAQTSSMGGVNTDNLLSSDGKLLLAHFKADWQKFKEEIKSEILTTLQENIIEIAELKRRCSSLEETVKKVQDAADATDQYSRKDSIILSGNSIPAVAENESCQVIVQNLLRNKLNIDVSNHEISITHPLGAQNRGSSSTQKRSIYVKLCRRGLKREIIQKSKNQQKPVNFYCNDSLTPLRSRIFQILRKMKINNPNIIKGCTTMDGKVYVFTKPVRHGEKDQRHWIVNMDTLSTFCRDHLEKSLDTFLDESNTIPNRG